MNEISKISFNIFPSLCLFFCFFFTILQNLKILIYNIIDKISQQEICMKYLSKIIKFKGTKKSMKMYKISKVQLEKIIYILYQNRLLKIIYISRKIIYILLKIHHCKSIVFL